jgi:D-cysteine desulfhydrase family pyridoxal phosphate-dependent enzyme
LDALQRVELAVLPTPLQDCPRLAEVLGGPRIFVKRDDLTGLAFGGNKTRRLEFVMGDAQREGADCIIAGAYVQSNHCRQTAAAAAKMGMKPVLVLSGPRADGIQGNLLLDAILGADIVHVPDGDPESIRRVFYGLEIEYRQKGYRPYVLDTFGPSGRFGVLAYVYCALELDAQFQELGIEPTHIVNAVGSAGTHAGLALGAKALGANYQVYGISIRKSREEILSFIEKKSRETARALGLPYGLARDEVIIDDTHRGGGYGVVTEAIREAIRLAARTEGLILDPTYSGKVMAGLIDLVSMGRFGPQDSIVFLHSGGTPIVFAKAEELATDASFRVVQRQDYSHMALPG